MVVGGELAIEGVLSLTSNTSMTTDTRDIALRTAPAAFVLHAYKKLKSIETSNIPYSLKVSRLKISRISQVRQQPRKISSMQFQVHNECKTRLELDHENLIHKKYVFEQNLANRKIFYPRKF